MLMSIHPKYVSKILDGSKTIELRRSKPLIEPGQEVLIYATTPVAALTARCRVSAVESLLPADLWLRYSVRLGVTREQFNDYFSDTLLATALHLYDVEPLADPIPLSQLCSAGPFHPPQTWHFLDATRTAELLGAASHDAGPLRHLEAVDHAPTIPTPDGHRFSIRRAISMVGRFLP